MAGRSTWVAGHGRPATHDVIVVGGGAAGLSAALVLGRARRRVVVVDDGRPRNAPAPHMQGFLSRDGTPPLELVTVGRSEVEGYGVEVIDDEVVDVEPGFSVRLRGGGVLVARRILIATGATDQLPDIPGTRERWGKDFLHCPYCHGWEVRDQPLGVLATQVDSVHYAQLVRQWSDDLVFFTHTQTLSVVERVELEARGIEVIDGVVERLVVEDDRLTGVELGDGRLIARSALFIRPANLLHADGLAQRLGVELDEAGFVAVDATGRTSVPGVWAAGNAVDPRAQVIAAAGAGNTAAIAINADLVAEDVRNAVKSTTDTERAYR